MRFNSAYAPCAHCARSTEVLAHHCMDSNVLSDAMSFSLFISNIFPFVLKFGKTLVHIWALSFRNSSKCHHQSKDLTFCIDTISTQQLKAEVAAYKPKIIDVNRSGNLLDKMLSDDDSPINVRPRYRSLQIGSSTMAEPSSRGQGYDPNESADFEGTLLYVMYHFTFVISPIAPRSS